MLSHPSVKLIGFRKDLPEVMRKSDVFVLPSIEEGSALVTYDARGSGCVLLVSDATGAVCNHNVNALIHKVGDIKSLAEHLTLLDQNRTELERLRINSLATTHEITWAAAARKIHKAYSEILHDYGSKFRCTALNRERSKSGDPL
jgi:glycosyltransferase involved in cell wall biosynthesis